MLGVGLLDVATQAEDQDQHEQSQTHDYVTRMQAHQRVKGSSEKIGGNREMMAKDQTVPFESGGTQKFQSKENCDQQPKAEFCIVFPAKRALRPTLPSGAGVARADATGAAP